MIIWGKSLLNTLMQIFIMLRHLAAEISRFKFDDHRVIRTGASDLKLFWAVYMQPIFFKLWYDSIVKCITDNLSRKILAYAVKNVHDHIFILWQMKG